MKIENNTESQDGESKVYLVNSFKVRQLFYTSKVLIKWVILAIIKIKLSWLFF